MLISEEIDYTVASRPMGPLEEGDQALLNALQAMPKARNFLGPYTDPHSEIQRYSKENYEGAFLYLSHGFALNKMLRMYVGSTPSNIGLYIGRGDSSARSTQGEDHISCPANDNPGYVKIFKQSNEGIITKYLSREENQRIKLNAARILVQHTRIS